MTTEKVTPDLQVLVLGLCRTGTLSIKTALERLGYRTYHMFVALETLGAAPLWVDVLEKKFDRGEKIERGDLEGLLAGFDAVTDVPCAMLAPELMAMYPNAKVILTVRDMESWVRSMDQTIAGILSDPYRPLKKLLIPAARQHIVRLSDTFFRTLFYGSYSSHSRRVYLEHNQLVRALGANHPGGFLEYEVKQGWGPLCKFLGKEVPEEDFPRLNDMESFKKIFRRPPLPMGAKIVGGVVSGVVLAGVVWWWKR